jgi:Na+/melibiose symporter-like transporter
VSVAATSPSPPKGVALYKILAFGTTGMPLAALLLVYGLYLPRFYAGLGLSFLAVSGAIALVRFIDLFFDPLVALVMDRTKTPVGRYRPWLIMGTPLAMIGAYRLLIPGAEPTPAYLILWLLVTYSGLSMITLGVASWAAILATGYHDRSRVFGWTQGMGVVGSVAFLLLPVFTHGKVVAGKAASMPAICTILLVALPLGIVITSLFTPEKILQVSSRPQFKIRDYWSALTRPNLLRVVLADFVLTLGPGTTAPLYVYFFHDAKGFSIADVGFLLIFYIGAGILGAPFWARVARRFGKHRTIQIACVVYAIFQTILMALPRVHEPYARVDTLPTAAGMFCVGFCASAFLLLIRAMVADICDEVKLEQKQDLTSLIFSMVTTTTKFGATITVIIVLPILQFVGYNGKEGAVNTPHAIFGLEMCYLFAPIILVFVGGAMLFGYKLDAKRHAEIQAALEQQAASAHLAASEESLIGPTAGAPAE